MPQLFVGFDINKNSTGLAVLNSTGKLIMEDVFTGCKDISFDSIEALRIYDDYFQDAFVSLALESYKGDSEINLFIEKPYVNAKMQDLSLFLARVTGMCANIFAQRCIGHPYTFTNKWINNKTLKKFTTGSGNASKIQLRNTIEELYPLGEEQKMTAAHRSDRADAISVAYMGLWCNAFLNNNSEINKIPEWDNHLKTRQATALR